MTPTQVLNAAADYIEARGFCHTDLAPHEDIGTYRKDNPPTNIDGAISMVTEGRPDGETWLITECVHYFEREVVQPSGIFAHSNGQGAAVAALRSAASNVSGLTRLYELKLAGVDENATWHGRSGHDAAIRFWEAFGQLGDMYLVKAYRPADRHGISTLGDGQVLG